jgi:hypothetical protein
MNIGKWLDKTYREHAPDCPYLRDGYQCGFCDALTLLACESSDENFRSHPELLTWARVHDGSLVFEELPAPLRDLVGELPIVMLARARLDVQGPF